MFNKKRIIVFVLFILLMFFMMTFAGSPTQNAAVATREVIFTDGYDGKDIAKYEVEVGKDSQVPDDPYHKNYVFVGWYDYNNHDIRVTDFTNVLKDIHVIALYGGDKNNNGINDEVDTYLTVTFVNSITKDVIKKQKVLIGMDATAPNAPTIKGYTFEGWDTSYVNVTEDITVYTIYTKNNVSPQTKTYTVTFIDGDTNEVMSKVKVKEGASATPPTPNTHEGRLFKRWDGKYTNVKSNQTVIAIYVDDQNGNGVDDETEKFAIRFNAGSHGKIKGSSNYTTEDTYLQGIDNYPASPDSDVTADEGYTFTGWNPTYNAGSLIPLENPTKEFTAQYKVNQYTITFDTNGGNTINPITQDYGTSITKPENPTKEGYTFAGWDKEIPSTMPAEDMTITASWTVNQYTITFDTKGGSTINPITQNYGTDVTAPADPTKEGYTFAGWDREIPTTMPAENITITASWTVNQYTITFDTNGGNTINPITQNYGTDVTKPQDPTKEGYTFVGWDKEIPSTMPAENITITASWSINKYTITFDTQGGTVILPITQDYGTDVTAPENPTKEGYTFAGWDREIPTTMPAENITITASWTVNQYTITFDTQGGSTIDPITQNYGTDVTAPANPTKQGYVFAGWDKEIPTTMPAENMTITASWNASTNTPYKVEHHFKGIGENAAYVHDSDKDQSFTGTTGQEVTASPLTEGIDGFKYNATESAATIKGTVKADGSLTLIVKYDRKTSIVIVNPDDPECDSNEEQCTKPTEEEKEYGDTVTLPYVSRTYTLTYEPGDGAPAVESQTVTAEIDYYCKGTSSTCAETDRIILNKADKTVDIEATNATYTAHYTSDFKVSVKAGSDYSYPTNNPTTDFKFVDWADKADITKKYQENAKIVLKKNMTLKGEYTGDAHEYTISYQFTNEAPTGATLPANQPKKYGESGTVESNPNVAGYSFSGWATTDVEVREDGTFTMPAKDVVFKGSWTINQYTITFDTQGGSTINPITQNYGTDVTAPADPTKEGYTFAGWDKEIPSTMPAEDMTITASWTVNQYTITFDTQGGSTIDPITQNYGTDVTAPANPTKEGYTFAGWDREIPTTMPAEDITITASWTINQYTITFDTQGGSTIDPITQNYGTDVTAPANPTKEGYTFAGWDREIPTTMPAENITITASWSINSYTVIFNNDNNTEITRQTVNYGNHVSEVTNPTKESTAQYTYAFAGWADESGTVVDLSTYVVTEDVTFTATYSSTVRNYTIQFVNFDGSILQAESLAYGTTPEYSGDIPTRATDSQYTYTFAGWDSAITAVTGNKTYTATYSTTTNQYTITFVDDDGTQLQQTQVEYGTMPTAPENPTKASTAQYTYTFAGWSPELETVRTDKTYTATYEATVRKYTITFVDDDGTKLQETQVAYGTMPTAPENPTKESTAQYTYTFAGWNPTIVEVNGDKTYTATYNSTVRQYNYTVHKFFDGTEEGTGTQYSANYGTTIQSSTYATSVEHYKLDNENTTTSITISEVEANNVINIYYISTRANITVTVTSDIPSNGNVEYNDIITYTIKIKNTGEETGTVTVSDADLKTAISNGFVVLTDKNGNPLNTNADALAIVGDGLTKDITANNEETITLKVRVVANVDNDITSHITGTYTDGKVTDNINGTEVTAKVEKTIKFIEQSETLNGTNIVIVLDRSGSMSGNKFTNAKAAARSFINKVFTQTSNSNNSTISVYTFGTEDVETGNCIIGIPFTDICIVPETENVPYTRLIGTATDYTSAQSLVSTLNGNSGEMSSSIPNTSLTPYYIGFESAYKALFGTGGVATQDAYKNNANAVVFLTDGNPEYDNATLREQYVNNLHSKGVVIYTVGYNIGANSAEANLLRSISSPDGQSFILTGTDASALTDAFDAIHADVSGKQTPTQTEKGVAEMADPSEITVDANHPILISVNETADIKDRIKPDKTHEVIVFNPDGTVKVAFNTLAEATGEDNYLVLKDGKYDLNAKKFEASDVITVRYFVTRNSRSRKAKMNVFKGMMDYKNATEALYDDFGNPIERPEIDEEIINGTVESAVEETTPEVKEEEKPITEEVKETTEEKTEETKPETTETETTEKPKEEVKEETSNTSSEEVSEQPKENEPAKEEQVEGTKEEVKEESKEEVKTEEPKKEESKTEEKVEATEAKEETKVEEESKPEKKEKSEKKDKSEHKEEIKKESDKEVEVKVVEEEKESEEE